MKSTTIMCYPDAYVTIDKAVEDFNGLMRDKVFGEQTEAYACVVAECDDTGCFDDQTIEVFYEFDNLNDYLNSKEYSNNLLIKVYHIDKEGVTPFLYKAYDGCCYSRLAKCNKSKYTTLMAHRFVEMPVRIHIIECE